MQRTTIKTVLFRAPESAPGGGMNDSPNVRLEASSRLRLEIDDVGVIATVLAKDGAPLVSDNNPARYPWHGVRKVTGEPFTPYAVAAKVKLPKFTVDVADES